MNIYEMLKEGKTPNYIKIKVDEEIAAAQKMITEEEAAKARELKEARKNFINALEDYNAAITGEWLDRKAREKIEQLCIETEKEIAAFQHDLKEIEKLKKFPEKLPRKPFVREKTCSVKIMPKDTDDEVIKNFINNLV